jgi:hypothetical protein
LVDLWERETDLLARAECVSELKLLCAENPSFASIAWMKNSFLKQIPEITTKTCKMAIEELKTALLSLSVPYVNSCLKALNHLYDADGCNQKIKTIIDDAVKEIDALFLNLSVTKSAERAAKQLPQLGNKLHTFLEQFQLLGEFIDYSGCLLDSCRYRECPEVCKRNSINNASTNANLCGIFYAACANNYKVSFASSRRNLQVSEVLNNLSFRFYRPIRDALGPLKASILAQSLENLKELVDDVFTHDDKKGIVIVEKVSCL